MEKNKALLQHKKAQGVVDKNIISSFSRLEAASGIPKATLVNITMAEKMQHLLPGLQYSKHFA